MTRATIT
jgi:hypothetical protein